MTIPLVVCIIGFIVYFIGTRIPDAFISDVGKWAYVLGLAFTLAALIGVKPF